MEEIVDELAKRFPSADFEMLRYRLVWIYCEQFHSLINISCTEDLTFNRFRNIAKSNPFQWRDFPGKDKYELYVEAMKELMTVSSFSIRTFVDQNS